MTYNEITTADAQFLQSLCGPNRVFTGAQISEDFDHDEMGTVRHMPALVVQPASTQEVSQIMRLANQRLLPVTPRGQGTGLVGGAVPLHGGILLDMSKMNKILELDEATLTLTVEPGVLLMEIARFVEERGFFYPPDPGEKTATIGGNISTNAGGMRAVKYGVTRDYVRGLQVVLPSGEILETGNKCVKNSTGYDLKDLITGSEGTLAVITRAILKLIPLPKKIVSLLIPFPDLETAIGVVPKLICSRSTPTAIEFLGRDIIRESEVYLKKPFPDAYADAYLLLKFDGNSSEELEKDYESAAEMCLEAGAIDVLIAETQDRQEPIWSARGSFLEAMKATSVVDECDVVVPRDKVAEFAAFVKQVQAQVQIRILSFGHAGDGNLHVNILKDNLSDEAWQAKLSILFDQLYAKAATLGGLVSGEHGIGYAKKSYFAKAAGKTALAIMRGIKQVFDPNNILNPGKVIVEEESSPLSAH
jgi:glycolate oxidase